MDDEEVQKQLDHMVKFIYREADEKASEIQAKAQEEFSIEKARIVQEEKLKIMKEYERKEKQIEVKKKIAFSNELNLARLRLLKAREEGVQLLLAEAHQLLSEVSKDPVKYKALLLQIIVQGLLKLEEQSLRVVCRKQDLELVKGLLRGAEAEYHKLTGIECTLTIENDTFLPAGSDKGVQGCSGGVILSTEDGKIICSNTLDARLSMAFEQNLPAIRTQLFGESLTRKHRD